MGTPLIEAVRGLLLDRAYPLPLPDVPEEVAAALGRDLTDEERSFVVEQYVGAVHVVVLPVELHGIEHATPGPWRVQQRYDESHGAVGYASVHPMNTRRMIASTVGGTPAFRIADARLIVALRNAYRAATTVPADTTDKEV